MLPVSPTRDLTIEHRSPIVIFHRRICQYGDSIVKRLHLAASNHHPNSHESGYNKTENCQLKTPPS